MIGFKLCVNGEYSSHIFIRHLGHFFIAYAIALCKGMQYFFKEGADLTWSYKLNGGHIWAISFQNYAVKRYRCW